jgi:putative hydrolase of the HAD superfamily
VSRFSHLFLDLDDTLYPNTSGVWEAVLERIQTYIELRLNFSTEEAKSLRLRYLEQFGTTLSGLHKEFSVDVEDYLEYVHDVPLSNLLNPDPALKKMLQTIQIPRIIFTNAYLPYVEQVLHVLGIRDEIDQIIDIYALDFLNKPRAEAYQRAMQLSSVPDPAGVVFVDDRLANLEQAAGFGMTTVLVGANRSTNSHLYINQITELTRILPELNQASSRG